MKSHVCTSSFKRGLHTFNLVNYDGDVVRDAWTKTSSLHQAYVRLFIVVMDFSIEAIRTDISSITE